MTIFLAFVLNFTFNFISVEEHQATSTKIQIYPNPASDYFKISNPENLESIIVYNLLGRSVKSFKDFDQKSYAISDLQDGVYLLQLNSKDQSKSKTIRLTKKCL